MEGRLGRLGRLVALVTALGVLAQLLAFALVHDASAVAPLKQGWAHGWTLVALCVALTFAGDWVAVRVRHGEETEELTLFEAACVVDVLVLPGSWALAVPVVATVLCSTIRRRGLVKVVFNGANLAAAVAVLVVSVHLISVPAEGLTLRTTAGLTLGMLGLTGVNLIALSRVLAVVGGDEPWAVVRDGAKLSTVMAIGTVALGGTAVTLAGSAPALLPFSLMPAVALTFAFKAAAQESDERERSSRLLALSQVLAGRLDADEVLESFLDLTRQAFGADLAMAVLDPAALPGGSYPTSVTDDRERGRQRRQASPAEADLLRRSGSEGAAVLQDPLPTEWRRAVIAPLEAEGRRVGVIVLATRDKHRDLGSRELTLLTPLASALAVALRGAAHLARLVEERSKLKAVVDQSSDGILVLDGAGVVQLWSPALEALTGRPEAVALGRPLAALISTTAPDGSERDPFLAGRSLMSVESPRAVVELTVHREDGEQRVVRCAHAAVFDEDGLLVQDVVIVHDITRERQVERLKADFIATVSHELRTPVTPIKGYADLLRRRGHLMTEDKRNECLEVISDRAAHLARLVEDLLLASRISASEGSAQAKVDMARDDLSALVHRACGDFGDQGPRISITVPEHRVEVACDPVRVIQVLTNLVGNALKYSKSGTPVDVRLTVDGHRAVVEVHDVGRGIPADQLEKVFDKFHRVEDPMLMTTGGTGLGLYIARQLADAMGGTLTCASTLNVGSVFSFSLLLAPSPVSSPASAPHFVTTIAEPADTAPRPRRSAPWTLAPPRPEPADGVITP
ncbi:MAG: domain S-box protein [Frankiales bacterium]|nr:domain S-box protein [Frankiales bacterium]